MKIIPAIDIIGGKCVRLSRGDYQTQQVYHEDPLAMARLFEDHGIRYLHLVDLDGARSRQIVNHKVLYEISSRTSLKIDFGGGIKSRRDLNIAFESGASQVTVGSIAAQQPTLFLEWLHVYGADKIILGADGLKGRIATNGWQDTSSLDLVRFIADYVAQGVSTVICTDIDKDGMLGGPALDLYEEILAVTPVSLIASGGITSLQDLERLAAAGCAGAIIGKALYEQRISLKALAQLC